jgi:hypothetical protein
MRQSIPLGYGARALSSIGVYCPGVFWRRAFFEDWGCFIPVDNDTFPLWVGCACDRVGLRGGQCENYVFCDPPFFELVAAR